MSQADSIKEEPAVEQTETQKLADLLAAKARKQVDVATKYRQPKLDSILKAEELYYNRVVKTLRGRFNIPLPIVSGYVEALLAKIDDEIEINFDHQEDADLIRARKVSATWKYDSAPTRGMWAIKDLLTKKLAIFSGRGINKLFSESEPRYKNYLEVTDAFDFLVEPNGGWHLENHLFCGQEHIFRTKAELESGEQYDQGQVKKLVSAVKSDDYKRAADLYQNVQRRHNNLGLDLATNDYVGEEVFSMIEWNMYHEGKRYYLLLEANTFTWVRFCPLEEVTGEPPEGELPTYMWKSWATHYDAWNFWSKAPVDDVVPIAVALKTVVNFMMDDVQKRLWGQRIFDSKFFDNPADLEWDRPDKLVMATVPTGKQLSQGVYEFQTGDKSSVTVNLIDYMRNFVATESGVTPQTKGNSDEKILGIAKINEGEVADRLGLTNKYYTQFYAELGAAYLMGLRMCMTEKRLVRMIGERGAESSYLTREDLKFEAEPDIRITGGKTEARRNQEMNDRKTNGLALAFKAAPDVFNKKVTVEYLLENAGWLGDEITPMLDVNMDGDEMQSVRASQAIQDILNGKKPPLYKGALNRFTQKIIKFSDDNILAPKVNIALMEYGLAHKQIIIENETRKRMIESLSAPAPTDNSMAVPAPNGEAPAPTPPAPVISPFVPQPNTNGANQ